MLTKTKRPMLMQAFNIELSHETKGKRSLSQRMSVMKRKIASARGVDDINLMGSLWIPDLSDL